MGKKDTILATAQSLNDSDDNVKTYELDQREKNELQALVALVEQARLAQDLVYNRLVQSIAARHNVSNALIEIDMADVFQNGAEKAVLVAKFNEKGSDENTEEASEEAKE